MRTFSFLFFTLGLGLFSHPATLQIIDPCCGRCTGSSYCSACKTCQYCAYCNSGGSCGVCSTSPAPRQQYSSEKQRPSSIPSRNSKLIGHKNTSAKSKKFKSEQDGFSPESISLPIQATVIALNLNVRNGPGTAFEIIDKLQAADIVSILEVIEMSWAYIAYDTKVNGEEIPQVGYVAIKYLKIQ